MWVSVKTRPMGFSWVFLELLHNSFSLNFDALISYTFIMVILSIIEILH